MKLIGAIRCNGLYAGGMSKPEIPEEAVEVAARALHLIDQGPWISGGAITPGGTPWGTSREASRHGEYLDKARLALEAASPCMLAEAWDTGAVAGWKQSGEGWNAEYPDESTGKCSVDLSENPYREVEA